MYKRQIKGWAENGVTVIKTEEDAEKFQVSPDTKICVVSQTTFNYNKFKYLVEIISKKDVYKRQQKNFRIL